VNGVVQATSSVTAVAVAAALLLAAAAFAAVVEVALAPARAGRPPRSSALIAPLAEIARLLGQQRRTLLGADRLLWRIGGTGMIVVPLLMIAVVPLGDRVLFDSSLGIVWFNLADVFVWAFVWMVGWGANAVQSLIGGYRFLAQALAYELPLMFALTAPAVAAGSLGVGDVVDAQSGLWYVVWMPVAFVVVCLSVAGFSVWGPFGPALAGDIAGGVLSELSGPDRLVVLVGRYLMLAAGSAFAVALFLGGGSGPLLPSWLWMIVKTLVVITALVQLRRWLPLLRPDRFLEVGWMVLLPLTLAQVMVVAAIALSAGDAGGRSP
jgi:NADH-quinone oxidoreductase subunit H